MTIGYFVRNEELIEEEFNIEDVKSTDVLCIVDECTKQIFIWYGNEAGAKARFVGARESPGLREIYGKKYKMRTVSEDEKDIEFENALKSDNMARKIMGVENKYAKCKKLDKLNIESNMTKMNTDVHDADHYIDIQEVITDLQDMSIEIQDAPIGYGCDVLIKSMEIYRKSSNGFDKEQFIDGKIVENADAVRIDMQNGEIKSVEILRKV